MLPRPAPEWLAEFQAEFGAALRTPLVSTTGTFRATPSAYPAKVRGGAKPARSVSGDERLAVYNRQYWFRLFGVLQSAYPLVTRLLGHFRFNELASAFLTEHPPRGWSIDAAPDGFDAFLAATVPSAGVALSKGSGLVVPHRRLRRPRGIKDAELRERSEPAGGGEGAVAKRAAGARPPFLEREAVLEAAAIDAAFRRIFFAPPVPPFRPAAEDAARLVESYLVPSETVALLCEHRPLVDLRRRLDEIPGEKAVPLPPRLERAARWALVQKPAGLGQVALEPLEARLFDLLHEHPVGQALALLEAECPDAERPALPGRARAWLARSVELGFWRGLSSELPRRQR